MKKKTRKLIESVKSLIENYYPFLDENEQNEIFENFVYRSIMNSLCEVDDYQIGSGRLPHIPTPRRYHYGGGPSSQSHVKAATLMRRDQPDDFGNSLWNKNGINYLIPNPKEDPLKVNKLANLPPAEADPTMIKHASLYGPHSENFVKKYRFKKKKY